MSHTEVLIGDLAPEIRVETFLKGEPVAAFAEGTTYVVEFWATWCGPCKASIPHLTELQTRFPQVVVLGVAVTWKDLNEVRAFVCDQGDAIGYRIAADAPPAPCDRRGRMHSAWCEASYQQGVPCAFIVDGGGRIAWIGHPMELDAPLAAIVDGRWDLPVAAAAHREALLRDRVREAQSLEQAVDASFEANDRTGALRAYDAAFTAEPALERSHGFGKFKLLTPGSEPALAYGLNLITRVAAEDVNTVFKLGTVLSRQAGELNGDARIRSAALAVEALERVWLLLDGQTEAGLVLRLSRAHAEALLLAGRPAAAALRIQGARAAAVKIAAPEAVLAELDALAGRCEPVATTPSGHTVICEGDTCQLPEI